MAQGSIRKRGDRYYLRTRVREIDPDTGQVRWRQVERKAGTSYRDAERQLKTLQGQIDAKRFVSERTTVLELGRRWLSEHVQRNLKPSTAANYKGTFYTHVAPALGGLRVDEVDAEAVKTLLERKRKAGLRPETVSKIHRHMHAMFEFAELPVNPAELQRRRGPRRRKHKGRGTALTPMQERQFIDECSARWRLFFRVALSTGLRRGEMIGLRWGDVSLTERVIDVRRSICPYDDVDDDESLTTKTEAGERVVPLFPDALEALEELYQLAGSPADDDPVFTTVEPKPAVNGRRASVPGGVLSPRMVTKAFRRYADRAGLSEITLHDLRHTTITRLIDQGAPINLIAAIAGHSKTSTTTDVYGHLLRGHVQEAAQRFNPTAASHISPTDLPETTSYDVLSTEADEQESPANTAIHDA
jgi:integrase